jgi:hypothetical protein
MSKIRANFISSKNDNKAVEFTSGIVVGGAVTATNFDFNAEVYNVGTGASISNPANNVLALGTNNTEKVRITSAGTIGVGNNGSYPIYSATNDRNLILGTGNGNNGIQLHSSETGYAGVYFGDTDSGQSRYSGYVEYKNNENFLRFGTSNTEKVRITSGGNVEIKDGNLVIGTSGHGIDFSVTGDGTGTVGTNGEILDEYEEGTFTPQAALGITSPTYTVGGQQGIYTKIGNIVYYYLHLEVNGGTPNSSNLMVNGLPFTSSSSPVSTHYTSGTFYLNAGAGKGTTLKPLVFPNSSEIYMYYQADTGVFGVNGTDAVNSSGTNRFQILLSGFYRV